MSQRKALTGILAVVLFVAGATVWADTIEEVEKAIHNKIRETKSLTAKVLSEAEYGAEGYRSKSSGSGLYEYVRKGDKYLMRVESKDKSEVEMAGQKQSHEVTSLTIADGEYIYSLTDMNGQKSATKTKQKDADYDQPPFEGMRETSEITLLPEETIDGVACYVVQLTPKKVEGMQSPGKMVQHYRKDCGHPAKIVNYDADGKAVMTITYTDIKVNPNIDPSRFVFKAPEGVTVIDADEMNSSHGDHDGHDHGNEP